MSQIATYAGLKAGRPTFEWGSDIPPKWLVDAAQRLKVEGDKVSTPSGRVLIEGAQVALEGLK